MKTDSKIKVDKLGPDHYRFECNDGKVIEVELDPSLSTEQKKVELSIALTRFMHRVESEKREHLLHSVAAMDA
ncbi:MULTISPECIES: hypothetical protein [unclassified Bradyrhizobium]|uniref:hypothetical protein n=1 Tax=unclassified Bradyrhizobium TaxID=2631580 RepID=UPI001046F4C7|nr:MULTISPECIES: hypothetical protein [unclassified Bradyrhizobium]TCU75039.1 hypothetical protein EDE10_103254 [Bradyrhizobium sp. Y-H1]